MQYFTGAAVAAIILVAGMIWAAPPSAESRWGRVYIGLLSSDGQEVTPINGADGLPVDVADQATGTPAGDARGLVVRNIPSGVQPISGQVTALQGGNDPWPVAEAKPLDCIPTTNTSGVFRLQCNDTGTTTREITTTASYKVFATGTEPAWHTVSDDAITLEANAGLPTEAGESVYLGELSEGTHFGCRNATNNSELYLAVCKDDFADGSAFSEGFDEGFD